MGAQVRELHGGLPPAPAARAAPASGTASGGAALAPPPGGPRPAPPLPRAAPWSPMPAAPGGGGGKAEGKGEPSRASDRQPGASSGAILPLPCQQEARLPRRDSLNSGSFPPPLSSHPLPCPSPPPPPPQPQKRHRTRILRCVTALLALFKPLQNLQVPRYCCPALHGRGGEGRGASRVSSGDGERCPGEATAGRNGSTEQGQERISLIAKNSAATQ